MNLYDPFVAYGIILTLAGALIVLRAELRIGR